MHLLQLLEQVILLTINLVIFISGIYLYYSLSKAPFIQIQLKLKEIAYTIVIL